MDCYQAYYCGLCQSLGRKYGTAARMALSYDMTFAALLLTALYDPPTQTSQGRCAPHPLRTRPRAVNEFTDYAADMTVVLAYYNYLDDWRDDHKRSRLRLAKQLKPHLENIRRQWPRQCEAIHTKRAEPPGKRQQHRPGCPLQCLWRIAGRGVQPAGGFLVPCPDADGPRVGRVHLFDGCL